MADLRNLYQEVILDHNKKPRNFGVLEAANRHAHGYNPLCGDDYQIYAVVGEDGTIEEISFDGNGCAISKAAASMMTSRVKGKSVEEAEKLVEAFREMMVAELDEEARNHLGHLTVFQGVSQLPQRVKCAVLPWHTLHAALEGEEQTSTEGHADAWSEES